MVLDVNELCSWYRVNSTSQTEKKCEETSGGVESVANAVNLFNATPKKAVEFIREQK